MKGVEEHRESDTYLEKRQLKRGTAGWVLLAGLSNSSPQPFLTRFAFKSHREVTERRLPKS